MIKNFIVPYKHTQTQQCNALYFRPILMKREFSQHIF
jgi:hypothetical protein